MVVMSDWRLQLVPLRGLATGYTAEVVDKQLRGGSGMLSANFSSHAIHDIETTFELRI